MALSTEEIGIPITETKIEDPIPTTTLTTGSILSTPATVKAPEIQPAQHRSVAEANGVTDMSVLTKEERAEYVNAHNRARMLEMSLSGSGGGANSGRGTRIADVEAKERFEARIAELEEIARQRAAEAKNQPPKRFSLNPFKLFRK